MRRWRYLALVPVVLIGVVPTQTSAERTQALAGLAVTPDLEAYFNYGPGGKRNGTCWVRAGALTDWTRYPKWTRGTWSFSLRVMIKLQSHDSNGTVRTIRQREYWDLAGSPSPTATHVDYIEANPIRNVPGRKFRTVATVQLRRELQSGRRPVVWQRHKLSPWRRCARNTCGCEGFVTDRDLAAGDLRGRRRAPSLSRAAES